MMVIDSVGSRTHSGERLMQDVRTTRVTKSEFEKLLSPILGAAYGTALHMTRNRDEAEDLVQEAAILAYRAIDSFERGTNFKAWFFRILINRFRNEYRKKKREPEVGTLDDAPDLYMYVQAANEGLLGRTSDPAALVLGQMSEDQIATAIGALPSEFRVVSALYFMEELSYQEIAEIVDCPVGTVRSRLHRGRKMLQKALWQVAVDQGIIAAVAGEKEMN